jgi:hypothetical protein
MILRRELHWLTRHFKGYPVPLAIHDSNSPFDGLYEWNMDQWITIGNQQYYNEHGIIILGEVVASVIAHEYRHHLQVCRHGRWHVPSGMEDNLDLLTSYYRQCKWEQDAMMFERSMDDCRTESDCWFSLLDIPKSRARALQLP